MRYLRPRTVCLEQVMCTRLCSTGRLKEGPLPWSSSALGGGAGLECTCVTAGLNFAAVGGGGGIANLEGGETACLKVGNAARVEGLGCLLS